MSVRSLPSTTNLLTTGDTVAQAGPGQLYVDQNDDKAYRYVFNNHATTAMDPTVAGFWDGATGKEQGKVQPFNTANCGGPAGVPMAAFAAQTFGWIQVAGKNTNLHASGTVGVGAGAMVAQATGQFAAQTAGNPIVAINDGASVAAGTGKTLRLRFE